jgi:hypothetical protein
MLIKIVLVGCLVLAGMVIVKDGRILRHAGLTASCSEIPRRGAQAQDAIVEACKRGRLEGYPDLSQRSCDSIGMRRRVEYWSCPAPVVSSRAPRP